MKENNLNVVFEYALYKIKKEYIEFNIKESSISKNIQIRVNEKFKQKLYEAISEQSKENFESLFKTEKNKERVIEQFSNFIEKIKNNSIKIHMISSSTIFFNHQQCFFKNKEIYNKKKNIIISTSGENIKKLENIDTGINYKEDLSIDREFILNKILGKMIEHFFMNNKELKEEIYKKNEQLKVLDSSLYANVRYDKKSRDKLKELFNSTGINLDKDFIIEISKINEMFLLTTDMIAFDIERIKNNLNFNVETKIKEKNKKEPS